MSYNQNTAETEISVIENQKSFMLTPFLKANAWTILKEDIETLEQGDKVEYLPLFPTTYLNND